MSALSSAPAQEATCPARDRVGALYVNPEECVRGLRCLQTDLRGRSIFYEADLPDDEHRHLAGNAAFFSEILPGRSAALGSPGGAAMLGRSVAPVGALVRGHDRCTAQPDVVLQRGGNVVDLALVGGSAQLPRQLGALRQPGGTQRVALRDQSAGRIDHPPAAVGGIAVAGHPRARRAQRRTPWRAQQR